MNPIERSFKRVRGRPCWGVKRGYGSFLTLEFGEPHLEIREPKSPGRDVSRRVREALAVGADVLAVSCPYEISRFEDALKTVGADRKMEVRDVVELLAEALED